METYRPLTVRYRVPMSEPYRPSRGHLVNWICQVWAKGLWSSGDDSLGVQILFSGCFGWGDALTWGVQSEMKEVG